MILILMISHGTHGIHGRKIMTKKKIDNLFSMNKNISHRQTLNTRKLSFFWPYFLGAYSGYSVANHLNQYHGDKYIFCHGITMTTLNGKT